MIQYLGLEINFLNQKINNKITIAMEKYRI